MGNEAYGVAGWRDTLGFQCYKEWYFCGVDDFSEEAQLDIGAGGHGRMHDTPEAAIPLCKCMSAGCAVRLAEAFAGGAYAQNECNANDRTAADDYWNGQKSEVLARLNNVLALDATKLAAPVESVVNALISILDLLELSSDAAAIDMVASAVNAKISPGKGPYTNVLDIEGLDVAAVAASIDNDAATAIAVAAGFEVTTEVTPGEELEGSGDLGVLGADSEETTAGAAGRVLNIAVVAAVAAALF